MRQDLTHIQRWIAPGSRVLDLGCGNGEFLELLRDQRGVDGTGLEIDADNINEAVGRGLNILEQNMDSGLSNFPDDSFDTVVMAHALQAVGGQGGEVHGAVQRAVDPQPVPEGADLKHPHSGRDAAVARRQRRCRSSACSLR